MAASNPLEAQEFLRRGQQRWITLLATFAAPDGADTLRQIFMDRAAAAADPVEKIDTIHELRWVLLEDETKALFCSSWDGTLESYLEDFRTKVPELMDRMFGLFEGYPGINSPKWAPWILTMYVPTVGFYSRFPDVTNRQMEKALQVNDAFQKLLDAAN